MLLRFCHERGANRQKDGATFSDTDGADPGSGRPDTLGERGINLGNSAAPGLEGFVDFGGIRHEVRVLGRHDEAANAVRTDTRIARRGACAH